MKKIIVIFILAVSFLSVYAQETESSERSFVIGARAGIGIFDMRYSSDDVSIYRHHYGVREQIGLFAEYDYLWKGFSADGGNIAKEGGVSFKNGKKPKRLIKQLLKTVSSSNELKNCTVLDIFAGSGTTGESVLYLNAEDSGHRKFILCTNNENNICRDITYQRVKTVITGKRKDGSKYSDGLPGSLKYFKVDFVPVSEKEYYEYADKLLLHVRELVELENAVDFEHDKSVAIVLTEEEMTDFEENLKQVQGDCHSELVSESRDKTTTLYLGHDVLLSKEQKNLLKKNGIEVKIIPQYYYPELNG